MITINENENEKGFHSQIDKANQFGENARISEECNEVAIFGTSDSTNVGTRSIVKNRFLLTISTLSVIVIFALSLSLTREENKYSVILNDEGVEKMMDFYKNDVKPDLMMMDYLSLIVDNPQALYGKLAESECESEILDFVKNNKKFALEMYHSRIAMMLSEANVKNNQLYFVSNYVRHPTTTNQQDLGIERMLMRNMFAYKIYETLTVPDEINNDIEIMFHEMYNGYQKT